MGKGFTFAVEQEADSTQIQSIEAPEFVSIPELDENSRELKVRLDKWLWAARFFKTRALARTTIESGKVLYDGQEANPNMEIQIGATVQIQQGRTEKFVIVKGLSTRRKNSDDALELFEELPTSDVPYDNLTYPMNNGDTHSQINQINLINQYAHNLHPHNRHHYSRHDHNAYGRNQNDHSRHGHNSQSRYDNSQHGQNQHSHSRYDNSKYGQNQYNQSRYDNSQYDQSQHTHGRYDNSQYSQSQHNYSRYEPTQNDYSRSRNNSYSRNQSYVNANPTYINQHIASSFSNARNNINSSPQKSKLNFPAVQQPSRQMPIKIQAAHKSENLPHVLNADDCQSHKRANNRFLRRSLARSKDKELGNKPLYDTNYHHTLGRQPENNMNEHDGIVPNSERMHEIIG